MWDLEIPRGSCGRLGREKLIICWSGSQQVSPAATVQIMRLSENGLSYIKRWESFRPAPYDDGYGNPTIGYGHKIKPGESFTRISEAEGLQILAQDVAWAEAAVNNNV